MYTFNIILFCYSLSDMIILLKIKGSDGRWFGLRYCVAGIPVLVKDGEKPIGKIEVAGFHSYYVTDTGMLVLIIEIH